MPTIVIAPTALEMALHAPLYDRLCAELSAEGFTVMLEAPGEQRGAIQHTSVDIAVYLFEHADSIVASGVILTHLVRVLQRARPQRRQPQEERRAAVFDQDGAIVREILLEPSDTTY
jgi:hypothetical protein